MASVEKLEHEDKMDAEIRQASVPRTEPRTLNEMTMERAMAEAQKIYAQDPSQDFTKDAIDMATRENAPAKDAADANSLNRQLEDSIQGSGNLLDTKSETPPTPSTEN